MLFLIQYQYLRTSEQVGVEGENFLNVHRCNIKDKIGSFLQFDSFLICRTEFTKNSLDSLYFVRTVKESRVK